MSVSDKTVLITVPEAAAVLRISKTKAWEMAQDGRMPGVIRIGRNVRVSVERLREWIDEQARAADATVCGAAPSPPATTGSAIPADGAPGRADAALGVRRPGPAT